MKLYFIQIDKIQSHYCLDIENRKEKEIVTVVWKLQI